MDYWSADTTILSWVSKEIIHFFSSWRPKTPFSGYFVVFWMERVTVSQINEWLNSKGAEESVLWTEFWESQILIKAKILLCWFTLCIVNCVFHVFLLIFTYNLKWWKVGLSMKRFHPDATLYGENGMLLWFSLCDYAIYLEKKMWCVFILG